MNTCRKLYWEKSAVPAELHPLLENLSGHYPLHEGRGETMLSCRRGPDGSGLTVNAVPSGITVEYDAVSTAARGIGLALAGREGRERTVFRTLGIMLDCSRNAVMTVEHAKGWLRQLALMGYNMAMLYTEDTYRLPGEPCFGYMRGPYSMAEIKELDAYARRLGIEMIACIQVLGHMEQILQWGTYGPIKDTRNVMLADEPQTAALIEKMIAFWSEALTSRRIHIGMDETHDLGRGRFMDLHGYERGFDIFNRHLAMVSARCAAHGLRPMIWSDMYFRLGNPHQNYYDPATVIPDDVAALIPPEVDLVYWDYYHRDREFYLEWIRRHRDLGHEPLMGSGVWTWGKLWCDHEITMATVRPCLEACREAEVGEVFFTLWGDDGAYCEFDSALAGLCRCAELAFGNADTPENVAPLFAAVCGGDYRAHLIASELDHTDPDQSKLSAAALLWDDPLMRKYHREQSRTRPELDRLLFDHYSRLTEALRPYTGITCGGEIRLAAEAAAVIRDKYALLRRLLDAYRDRDLARLKHLADADIPGMIEAFRSFAAVFRTQWLRRNKPFGLDVIQVRLGGQIARWEELARVLRELLEGRTATIPELDENPDLSGVGAASGGGWGRWALSSVSIW